MNDHRVDELLKDLDDSLAIAPSAETVANVRSRIAEQSSSRGPWLSWRIAAAIAAGLAVMILGYLRWAPHTTTTPSQIARVTPPLQRPAPMVQAPTPETTNTPARATTRKAATPSATRLASATDDERLRVIVSPDQRRGVEQLQAALRAGRLTAESFAEPPPATALPAFELKALEIPSVAIEPLTVETPGSMTGGGSVR